MIRLPVPSPPSAIGKHSVEQFRLLNINPSQIASATSVALRLFLKAFGAIRIFIISNLCPDNPEAIGINFENKLI